MRNRMQQQRLHVMIVLVALLLAAVLPATTVSGFCPRPTTFARHSSTRIQSTSEEPVDVDVSDAVLDIEEMFPDTSILEFTLEHHKPLGCTVEESLAHPMEKHVFITKLVEDGFAQAAGLQVGDVLLAVPGIFGELSDVMGLGIEQVKTLVSGREESEPLELRVARGTDVMEKHETTLVELCMTPGANDKEVEECVTTIMAGAYVDEDDEEEETMMECDDEEECSLDDMFAMWAEDMPDVPKPSEEEVEEEEEEATVAPWSSRSSPSGTYQRDPSTGEMKRIS